MTFTRKDRDLIIEKAAELAEQCDLYPHTVMGSDNFNSQEHPMYLHLSKILSVQDHIPAKIRIFLRLPGGYSILRIIPDDDMVEVIKKDGFGTMSVKLSSTEEECFQESLVNPNALEYNTIQQIRKIAEYGIANYEEPE